MNGGLGGRARCAPHWNGSARERNSYCRRIIGNYYHNSIYIAVTQS